VCCPSCGKKKRNNSLAILRIEYWSDLTKLNSHQPCPLLLLEFLENDIEVPPGAAASALQVVVLKLIRQFEV
jgi:hypothetical protein